jgi:hypothetical protein
LEIGCHYAVVITTGGGLYRYQLHDLVEVVGYLGTCPLLRFVGKEAYVSDWFGEKLNERHVGQVLAELFARYTIQPNFAMVACDEIGATHFQSLDLAEPTKWPVDDDHREAQRGQAKASYGQDKYTSHPKSNPAYTLFIEAPAAADDTLRLLGDNLEAALQENYHYRYCRQLGQLGPLRVFRIDGNALATYLRACQAHGQRAGDIKPVALHRLGGWSQFFRGQTI